MNTIYHYQFVMFRECRIIWGNLGEISSKTFHAYTYDTHTRIISIRWSYLISMHQLNHLFSYQS